MKLLRQIILLTALLPIARAFANDYSVSCVSADYVICEGPPAFTGSPGVTTIRIGANNNNGSPSGRNAVMIFPLPALSPGEQVTTATWIVNVAGRSGTPAFNCDLWGIGFQGSTTALVEYFEANTGDSGNTKFQDNVIIPSFTSGNISISNSAVIGAYLQTFYATNPGYAGGSYVFLRMNPDSDSGTTSLGWSISAQESGLPAELILTTTGGPVTPPQITVQPQNQSVIVTSNAAFNVTATGQSLTYQWYFNGTAMTNGGRFSGATSSALNIASTITNDAGNYRVIVTNANGSATSSIATLNVIVPGAIATTNFIVIITDDHRWDSLGVVQREMGASGRFPWFTNGTPNLDRLAAGGVRFRNAFVTLALCSPSRAAILTGKYNHANGIINNSTAFPTASVTYASQLRAAGYVTGMVGKWHMGQQSARPGFDFSASFLGQGNYSNTTFHVNGVATPTTGWIDDVSTDYALEFINSNYARPFALHLGYKSTHAPHEAPDWADLLYTNSASVAVPNLSVPPPYRTNIANNSETAKRNYHRCLTAADVGVGRILDRLDQLGLATNTMVIFIGDNGFYLGEHGLGDKRSLYEESIRVPLLVRYPKLAAPAVRDDLVLNIDIAPTILNLAGVPVPTEMQGRSWQPLLNGGAVTNWRQSFLAEYILEDGFTIPTTVALRTTDSKLVYWPGDPAWSEMFNLTNDRYEVTNLFNVPAQANMRANLKKEFDRLMSETGLGGRFTNLVRNPNGTRTLSLTSGLGPRYRLDGSTNLQTWTPLAETKMTSTQANVTDTNTTTPPSKYYRLEWIGD